MTKPLLSIGIIFKNEIRCLERCLQSLQTLRAAVPCELVMADTGSSDGSRAVAARYADVLFDFPWVDDFSAARNAVIDRSSGKWYFTVDADEWLDGDISELVGFLGAKNRDKNPFCAVIQRNYSSEDLRGNYGDFLAVRLARLAPGVRYAGAIHERWAGADKRVLGLTQTILHHDGYVGLNEEAGQAKRARNMDLLRKKLEKEPESLRILLQCVESSDGDADHGDYIRRGVECVKNKKSSWERFGPPIFRAAVKWASNHAPEEFEGRLEDARAWFPDSPFTKLDVEYIAFSQYFNAKDYEKAIPAGERYLSAQEDYRAGKFPPDAMLYSSLAAASPYLEDQTRVGLAAAYFCRWEYEKARDMLLTLDAGRLSDEKLTDCVGILCDLQAQSWLDVSPVMLRVWEQQNAADEKERARRMGVLTAAAARVFPREFRETETEKGQGHAYTLFLPLAGKWEMGTAARVLEAATEETAPLLETVEDWEAFPIAALAHALERDAAFPLPGRPLNVEQMDSIAARLAQDPEAFFPLALRAAERADMQDWQRMLWTRGLLMAAVWAFPWSGPTQDEEQGMAIAHAFARMEEKFLPRCYAPEALSESGLSALPPLHRFGWYCAQAFETLDSGDRVGYVRLLRKGLSVCTAMKNMVEFLAEHTQEVQTLLVPPELKDLADQVRVILAQFAPDDPAVAALKQSEAYQKVAYLIEGTEPSIWGGQLQ